MRPVAVITISDTCFKDKKKNISGPVIEDALKKLFPQAVMHSIVIPDEKAIIEKELIYFCDKECVSVVITTGGTGLSARDVTPEATKAILHKEIPAISVAMTMGGLKQTPMAMLSRAVAGMRNESLIINMPGSKNAVMECLEIIQPVLKHAVELMNENKKEVGRLHQFMQHSCSMTSKVDASRVAARNRASPFPMVEMEEAFRLVDTVMNLWPKYIETVSIDEALGRVAAESLVAREPLPPFPASIKDGYACICADGAGPRAVRGALAAGDPGATVALAPGECARVNTGAPLPANADCVVQVEDTKLLEASPDGKTELSVEILEPPRPHQDVRPVGFDVRQGTVLVERGEVLDAARIGLLAGAGHPSVKVQARPRVALMSTGNELQEPSEEKLRPAHIRDSNRTMLKVLLKEHGYEIRDCGIARDEPGALLGALRDALTHADVLVCTGGVSMGDRDLLKPVLVNDFGATIHFGRVRMKPGKPTTFATCDYNGRKKFVFALPGNPVSAYVCALLFVLRALRVCAGEGGEGARDAGWTSLRVRLAHPVPLDARPEYARARLRRVRDDHLLEAQVLDDQSSSRLLGACGASVLLELPQATDSLNMLPAGHLVDALLTGRIQDL